jgi:hypothetical protein
MTHRNSHRVTRLRSSLIDISLILAPCLLLLLLAG